MSRGYGRAHRKSFSATSIQFDKLFKENSNRPSAARSAGTVGKWGITSFTSIRSTNINGYPSQYSDLTGTKQSLGDNNIQPIKPKKFFKSRNAEPLEAVLGEPKLCSDKVDYTYPSSKKLKASYSSAVHAKVTSPRSSATKKFFPSKRTPSPTPLPVKRDESKPPIVLRICRGKSRLLSDSDESESTLTPATVVCSTVPLTSPARRDSHPSPGHTRVTRSTSKSLQDAGLSPATAETPSDTFSVLLSPEYIPPEKFELERKAMYENLLGPSSPKDSAISLTCPSQEQITQDEAAVEEATDVSEQSIQESNDVEMEPYSQAYTNSSGVFSQDSQNVLQDEEDKLEEDNASIGEQSLQINESEVENEDEIENEFENKIENENENEIENEIDNENELKMEDENQISLLSTNIEYSVTSNTVIPEPKKNEASDSSSEEDSDSSQHPPAASPIPEVTSSTTLSIDQHRDEIMEKILEKPPEAPPVKLVISKKKGSIFKSRSMIPDVEGVSKKRRVIYRHKWLEGESAQKPASETVESEKKEEPDTSPFEDEYGFQAAPLTRVTIPLTDDQTEEGETITSVKCTKKDKDYYTVVRNVKKAHQIQEIGEFQEFNDDVEYILDALQDNNPISTRCLSAITLASKCMVPAFRMHVRAHGVVAKFFKALHDATKDQSLGLCTATVMFVLSQDRLNMDLDRDCLELMLNLLESDVSYQKALDECGLSSVQLHKNKLKVRELCAEIQSQGHAMHLNLDNITVGQLAMETLLSLTSKRSGEWFKEELRELGGLQHIMETICECCRQVSDYVVMWTDSLLDKLRKVDRCMRVLENVTHNNEQNQTFLLQYNNGVILDTLVKLYRLCDSEIPLYPVTDITDKESTGTVIREALLVTLKVLINLTHHFNKKSMGSALIGRRQGIIDSSLHLLLQVPHYIPEQKKFELGVLVLMLLINLIQDNESNKKLLVDAKAPADLESIFPCDKSALEALIVQFYHCEELARMAEKRTNAILDGEKDHEMEVQTQPKSHEEFIEETVAKLLQKAGSHMEYTFLASYIVMLIGFLVMDNPDHESKVRPFLKGQRFDSLIDILKKFFNFMNLTASTEASNVCQIKATERVIKYMEEADKGLKQTTAVS